VTSLNAPLPRVVARLASDLAAALPAARERGRGEHSLVVKRLGEPTAGEPDPDRSHRLAARLREALAGTPAFEARIAELDLFEEPTAGPAPVVYLAVESSGLRGLHARLCDEFGAVDGLEGDEYVPHVTVARGGDADAARRLVDRAIDPVEWVVSELVFYHSRHSESSSRFSLPA
jgi:2'-5' RNA ligase